MVLFSRFLFPILFVVPVMWASAQVEDISVDFAYVEQQAKEVSAAPFQSPAADLPEVLQEKNLNYDRYREIRFRREKALWHEDGLKFWVEFFHPGYIFREPVHVWEFTDKAAQNIRFVQDFFDYGSLDIKDQIPVNTGYAGFRLLYPLNKAEAMDEVAVFQGASYFRLLAKGLRYGQSARGLALDCGGDGQEEFPLFTRFWLGKPEPGVEAVTLYALLDSVSCAGAYAFTIKPGETTSVDIEATLFFRSKENGARETKVVGLAPLTSMFWFGENTEGKPADYRGEVHDSDGLLLHTAADERIWRPLCSSEKTKRYSVFEASGVKGFGLLQRDRDFRSYQEIFNFYHQTPSVFITPKGNWGAGEVHLVELDTVDEYKDNVVAFWVPKTLPAPGEPFHFAYNLSTGGAIVDALPSHDIVEATRVGVDIHNRKTQQFAVDFVGPKLAGLTEESPPEAAVSCSENAHIAACTVHRNPFAEGWRVMIKLEPHGEKPTPVSLRCTLKNGDAVLTETWDYLWTPKE